MRAKHYAIHFILGLVSLVIVFHLMIVLKLIPYEITWGGRLKNVTEMYFFETISILVNLWLIWIVLMKGKLVNFRFSERVINFNLWIFLLLFVLNTLGNIVAQTNLEKMFAVITLVLAGAIWLILKSGTKKEAATK